MGKVSGRRPVGRHRYRWRDEVHKDLKDLGASGWTEHAQNREA